VEFFKIKNKIPQMSIRTYSEVDYLSLKKLYETSGWFDPETDSEERISKQVKKEHDSVIVAEDDGKIVGTVTLLFTSRLGLFFRLIAIDLQIRNELINRGSLIFKERGYKEVHILVPEEDTETQAQYINSGFTKGKAYRWFWKNVK
jgi:hypothetical protein